MTNTKRNGKLIIVSLIISLCLLILSTVFLFITVSTLVNLSKNYPQPIDSFWTIELAVTLFIIFFTVIIISFFGVLFCIVKWSNLRLEDKIES